MAKKTAKKAAAAKGFSTGEVTAAIKKALTGLRAERKANSGKWKLSQHLQAAACETTLVVALKHCSCSTMSHTFPKAGLDEAAFLSRLRKR